MYNCLLSFAAKCSQKKSQAFACNLQNWIQCAVIAVINEMTNFDKLSKVHAEANLMQ